MIRAYLLVVVLHGLWDSLGLIIGPLFTVPGPEVLLGQLIVGAVSIAVLIRRWREATRATTLAQPDDGVEASMIKEAAQASQD